MSTKVLKLKAVRSTVIHSLDGKHYRLHAGENVLTLEYKDYVALAKSLGLKVDKEAKEDAECKIVSNTEDTITKVHREADNEALTEDTLVEQDKVTCCDEDSCNFEQEDIKSDYASMSYNDLKNEYKRITSKSCRLKKDELITFLQEHSNV
jgi:hypothetical protein